MIPKEAIAKAIEGGWGIHHSLTSGWLEERLPVPDSVQKIAALDPSFWQALGKALGWYYGVEKRIRKYKILNEYKKPWQIQAFRFYDLILTNNNTDKFWKDLLTSHQ